MIDQDLFAKYDVPVPRYTSYPTVPQWSRTPTGEEWLSSLGRAVAEPDASLALYIHLPFCESLCTYCGCNTVITRDHARSEPYADLVLKELDLYLAALPSIDKCALRHIHLGGGTPTFSSPEELARLLDGVTKRLPERAPVFEGSVEADPRVTTPAHLEMLRERGFLRLSLGVQDFDETVQDLVNRQQPYGMVETLTAGARGLGFESINFDLIYGLPGQTEASQARLADQVLALRPDRLAVYSFARVPWIKPQQRKFKDEQIPVGAEKRALYEVVRDKLLAAGYVEIGMDHFALPSDGLAVSAAAGTMYRNFMGYAERRTTAMLGLGVSSISETPDCYHQNEKVITLYERRIQRGEIPTLRGHVLSDDDRKRRERILSLMTTYHAELGDDEVADAREYLAPMIADGLVTLSGRTLVVLPAGRPFLRNAAAVFDLPYRTAETTGPMYSRAL
jgi:oxygen-independent coproporphyrinogen-3 oxidase